jgi:hypothetical protein
MIVKKGSNNNKNKDLKDMDLSLSDYPCLICKNCIIKDSKFSCRVNHLPMFTSASSGYDYWQYWDCQGFIYRARANKDWSLI